MSRKDRRAAKSRQGFRANCPSCGAVIFEARARGMTIEQAQKDPRVLAALKAHVAKTKCVAR